MDVPTPEVQTNWLTYVLGILMALLAWVGEIYRRRVDDMKDDYVTRQELKEFIAETRHDREKMHDANIDRLDIIHNDMNRVHERIDDLARR